MELLDKKETHKKEQRQENKGRGVGDAKTIVHR